jgi:outer membrane protein assembly factor BamB
MRTRAILLPSVALVVVLGTSGCGSSTVPSPAAAARSAAPPAASPPSASPGAIASPSKAPVAVTDWHGFRGDAGHTGNAATGPVGRPVVNWQFHAKAAVPHAIAIIGDDVMVASDDGTVYALDRLTGKERWSVKAGTPTLIGPWAADDRLYFRDGTGAVLALDASTGQTLWTSAATYDGSTEPVADHGTVYVSTSDARIVAIDGATGAETWSMKPSPSTQWMGNPAVADGRLFVGSSEGFVAIDLATHKTIWTGDTHGEQTGTATANDGIAFIATGGDATVGAVRAFDAETGALRWMSAQQRLTFPVAADGLAFSSTMDGLVQAMDLRTGALRWSLQLTGKIRPMATANHVLYIAADTEKHV